MFREPALEADKKKKQQISKGKTGSFDKSKDQTVKGWKRDTAQQWTHSVSARAQDRCFFSQSIKNQEQLSASMGINPIIGELVFLLPPLPVPMMMGPPLNIFVLRYNKTAIFWVSNSGEQNGLNQRRTQPDELCLPLNCFAELSVQLESEGPINSAGKFQQQFSLRAWYSDKDRQEWSSQATYIACLQGMCISEL